MDDSWEGVEEELGDDLEDVIDVEATEVQRPSPEPIDDPEHELRSMLGHIGGQGGRVQLWRKKPTWCAGFLCTVEIEPGEQLDLEQIKRDWGGGTIAFRPQLKGERGYQFVRGGVHLQFSGPPLERGQLITPDGRPAQQPAMLPATYTTQQPTIRTGNPGIDFMGQLFERLDQRLERLELRIAQPAPAPDPLADVRRTVTMAKAFGELQNIFSRGGDPEEEEEEEEEDAGPPTLEDMAMMYLSKKMEGEVAKIEQPTAPPSRPPPPSAPARPYVKPQEPPQAPAASRPPPPRPAPKPPERDPWASSELDSPDPWLNVVPIAGAEAQPSEPAELVEQPSSSSSSSSALSPEQLVAALQQMPTDEAIEFLSTAVNSIPKEKMMEFVRRMQEE